MTTTCKHKEIAITVSGLRCEECHMDWRLEPGLLALVEQLIENQDTISVVLGELLTRTGFVQCAECNHVWRRDDEVVIVRTPDPSTPVADKEMMDVPLCTGCIPGILRQLRDTDTDGYHRVVSATASFLFNHGWHEPTLERPLWVSELLVDDPVFAEALRLRVSIETRRRPQ